MLLQKANSYNDNSGRETLALLEMELNIEEAGGRFQRGDDQEDDAGETLVLRPGLQSLFSVKEVDKDLDDAGSFDAKYFYEFISALFE